MRDAFQRRSAAGPELPLGQSAPAGAVALEARAGAGQHGDQVQPTSAVLWVSRRARVLNAGAEPGSGLILMQKPFDEQERIDEDSTLSR